MPIWVFRFRREIHCNCSQNCQPLPKNRSLCHSKFFAICSAKRTCPALKIVHDKVVWISQYFRLFDCIKAAKQIVLAGGVIRRSIKPYHCRNTYLTYLGEIQKVTLMAGAILMAKNRLGRLMAIDDNICSEDRLFECEAVGWSNTRVTFSGSKLRQCVATQAAKVIPPLDVVNLAPGLIDVVSCQWRRAAPLF